MTPFFRCVTLSLIASLLLAFSCVEAEVERPTYEVGEPGVLVIRNPGRLPMAIGGCNPTFYQERLPGRWVFDPFLRLSCAFFTDLEGKHTLSGYELILPKSSIRLEFPTDWLQSQPGIMRILQRVSVACEFPRHPDEPITCSGVEIITTDPVVIFEPGTSETIGQP